MVNGDLALGVLLLVFALVGVTIWALDQQRSQPPGSIPSPTPGERPNRQPSQKNKARTAAELQGLIETLPVVKVLDICDGDTLYVAKGWSQLKVRLDSIDCPEDGQHWGNIATYGLIKLVGGRRTVHMEEHGVDDFGRTLATLYVRHANGRDWQNVNERLVTLGHAWVMRAYYDHLPPDRQQKLNKLEAWAKSKNVGLWGTPDPVPPWQWRRAWRPPAH